MLKSTYRYSAFVAIIGVWIVFIIGMGQVGLSLNDSRPLSYLGVSEFASYFKSALLLGLALMALFYFYLQERFEPNKVFRNLYFAGLAMQAIVAFTPYSLEGKYQWPHWTAAIILALVLISLPWFFAQSEKISKAASKTSRYVTVTYLIVLVIEAGLLIGPKYYAISELFNVFIFHAWILYITFLPYKNTVA